MNDMGLIKDIYSPLFYDRFSESLSAVLPSFSKQDFTDRIFEDDFKNKEWKERMKHTTRVLHEFLPADFPKAVKTIKKIISALREQRFGEDNLAFMFFPDYIETYGLDDFDHAVEALEFITQFVSCEFAVRPFIIRYGDKMLEEMRRLSLHENHKVRRFASEGSRPRLPWAMAIPELKKNPAAVLPILENLKNDPSEWVRRSVANNLNDIAKDHPELVIEIAQKWRGISKETDAIIKHGSRTLLKQGHVAILKQYGLESKNIELGDFTILTPSVKIGDSLEFSIHLKNNDISSQTVRLEYAVYYQKSRGHLAKKVYKISERVYQPEEFAKVHRKQSFRLITTRKFHAGLHQLSIIVNGEEKALKDFELTI